MPRLHPDADDNETALIEATQLILDVMPSRYNDCFYEIRGNYVVSVNVCSTHTFLYLKSS